jgi:membrane protein
MFKGLNLKIEHWLFDLPEEVGGQPLRWLTIPLRYLYALLRDLVKGDLSLRAMSLVYSSLFAIVPIAAVAFAILKAFGYHRQLEPVLHEFLRPLGEQGYELSAQIMGFVENVRGTLIGTIGFVFLLYTVLSMIKKVEEALNFTWHVERPRGLGRRMTEYLVVMLIGPVVAVLAMALLASFEASALMERLSGLAGGDGGSATHGNFAPYVLMVGLFLFMYLYIPNTRVRFVPAAIGATFSGVLWAGVGAIFTRVVVHSTRTLAVYAGFAVVLMFLIWLHLSWLILLLGAQLSFYVQHPEYLRTGHAEIPTTSVLRERLAMSVMVLIGQRFVAGGSRWSISELAERLAIQATVLNDVLMPLEKHGLVMAGEDDTVAPARDLASIQLGDIMDAIRHEVPDPRRPEPSPVPLADETVLVADEALRASMAGRSLRELISPES